MKTPFEIDIYISYAHRDNHQLPGRSTGWVDQLRSALEVRLSQILGESIRVWMDRNIPLMEKIEDAHAKAFASAATMVCIVTPSYVKSEFCLREFADFAERRPPRDGKLSWFKVVKYPIPFAEGPRAFERVLGYQFFETDGAGRVREFDAEPGGNTDQYWHQLTDLAYDLAASLESARHPLKPSDASPAADLSEFLVSTSSPSGRSLTVFLCHSSTDKAQVRTLCDRLETDGLDPWLDERKLLPGQRWEDEIPKAVRGSDVVVICMSQSSIAKRGYLQRELTFALDIAQEQPEHSIFLIPARLEECGVPERLRAYHWVNLYDEGGYTLLLKALQARASSLSGVARHPRQSTDDTGTIQAGSAITNQNPGGQIAHASNIVANSVRDLSFGASTSHAAASAIVDVWNCMLSAVDATLDATVNLAPRSVGERRRSYDLLAATPLPELLEQPELSAWEAAQNGYFRAIAPSQYGNEAKAAIDQLGLSVARARLYISSETSTAARNIAGAMQHSIVQASQAGGSIETWRVVISTVREIEAKVVAFETLLKTEIARTVS